MSDEKNPLRVYLASRYQARLLMAEWRDKLEALGFAVTSRWITGAHELGHDAADYDAENRRFAKEDLEDVRAAHILVAFSPREHFKTGRGGRHAEFGYALADGKKCVVVGEREHVFHWLADVVPNDGLIPWLERERDEGPKRREARDAKMCADAERTRAVLEPHRGKWVAMDWEGKEVFHADADSKALMAWIKANRPREDQATRVYRVPEDCTCGSGAHPRRCAVHPAAYERHVAEINAELFEGGIPAVPLPDRRSEAERVRERWDETRGIVGQKVEILTKILGLCPDCKDVPKNFEDANVKRLCERCRLAFGGII